MKQILALLLASATLCFAQAPPHQSPNGSSFVCPEFLSFESEQCSFNDYRPVLNADATYVIFERNAIGASDVKLYSAEIAPGSTPQPFVSIPSNRADWCWDRSGAGSSGPVAFSGDQIYTVAPGCTANCSPSPVPGTSGMGMIYPTWYPDCQHLAVDVGATNVTEEIDATTGDVVVPHLGNRRVWAGFPSVNQKNPNLVAFAGQFNGESAYYNQDINYVWVTNRSTNPPVVTPMDRHAPTGPVFQQKFQARAGWFSPDGRWFAFESNRACNQIDGMNYAIFIQDSKGTSPAMQVTDCSQWNVQHPKWFPRRIDGRVYLVAAVASAFDKQCPPAQFRIARFDVTAFVSGSNSSYRPAGSCSPGPTCSPVFQKSGVR